VGLRISFFAGSVVGYVDNPSAIYTRGLALGLALRGNDVRVVEERRNAALTRTLRAVGSSAVRHFHEQFEALQHTTYEPRTGARLLEWVTRELALIDVAVAVDGLEDELCRWIANVSRERIRRAYLTWQPDQISEAVVQRLELERFDVILAPTKPMPELPWRRIEMVVAEPDRAAGLTPAVLAAGQDPVAAATTFERAIVGNQ
jgi:hypothetical protein